MHLEAKKPIPLVTRSQVIRSSSLPHPPSSPGRHQIALLPHAKASRSHDRKSPHLGAANNTAALPLRARTNFYLDIHLSIRFWLWRTKSTRCSLGQSTLCYPTDLLRKKMPIEKSSRLGVSILTCCLCLLKANNISI